ncbi:hypothetical protein ACFQ7B_43660 [Streptomyces erythrochromogenes]|uniref:hypothetical protein n=1 Tax=Streptomyces erythrochromogenes TaxID=285574 RepID=UPI0036854C94
MTHDFASHTTGSKTNRRIAPPRVEVPETQSLRGEGGRQTHEWQQAGAAVGGLLRVPSVPAYWNAFEPSNWTMRQGTEDSYYSVDLPKDSPAFRQIVDYIQESISRAPYTSPAKEDARMQAVREDLSLENRQRLTPIQRKKLEQRLREGDAGAPSPPRSRNVEITRVECIANEALWERYATAVQLYRQSRVRKGKNGWTPRRDTMKLIKWARGEPPLIGARKSWSNVPLPESRMRECRLTGDPLGPGEAYLFHGTRPEIIDLIMEGGFKPWLAARQNKNSPEAPPKYGLLGQGAYFADSASKSMTYDRCVVCRDYDCVDASCLTPEGDRPVRQIVLSRVLLGNPDFATFYRSRRAQGVGVLPDGRTSVVSNGLRQAPFSLGASMMNEFLIKDRVLAYPEFRIHYRARKD